MLDMIGETMTRGKSKQTRTPETEMRPSPESHTPWSKVFRLLGFLHGGLKNHCIIDFLISIMTISYSHIESHIRSPVESNSNT